MDYSRNLIEDGDLETTDYIVPELDSIQERRDKIAEFCCRVSDECSYVFKRSFNKEYAFENKEMVWRNWQDHRFHKAKADFFEGAKDKRELLNSSIDGDLDSQYIEWVARNDNFLLLAFTPPKPLKTIYSEAWSNATECRKSLRKSVMKNFFSMLNQESWLHAERVTSPRAGVRCKYNSEWDQIVIVDLSKDNEEVPIF